MTSLFEPFTLKDVTLRNRIAVSPMCQYSADDGMINDWHRVHLGALARGGAGLLVVEATGVSPEGRITPGCLGLWNDEQAATLAQSVQAIKNAGAVPGIQLGHAGRKASANRPWEGDDHIAADDPRGWDIIAPSPIAYGGGLSKIPQEMTKADIERVEQAFVDSAKRALASGFQWLELHFAHGYLAQSFLSKHSNHRTDEYGGSFENRSRFILETLQAVRAVWPDNLPLAARLGVIEFDGNDEETLSEAIELVKRMKANGLDFIDVSMGFSLGKANIPWGPAFLGPVAARVRREAGLAASTSWYISTPQQADGLVRDGSVDLVMLARPLLNDPHWAYKAAKELGVENPAWVLPAPYAHWLDRYRAA
jgi:2,4-dienoyl-CoA reductase-like NADH-dependent reductase (Old Yellow Enzyme family)